MVQNWDFMTDREIAIELGRRLASTRLDRNLSQAQIAEHAGLSLKTYKRLEKGAGTLLTLLAAMRALDLLSQLDTFLPEPPISPIKLAELKGKTRHRASGTRNRKET